MLMDLTVYVQIIHATRQDKCEEDGRAFPYKLQDLFLLRIVRTSYASLQPHIGIFKKWPEDEAGLMQSSAASW